MRVLFIQNYETAGLGFYEQYLREIRIPYDIIKPYKDICFPSVDSYSAYIVGGTPIPANDLRKHVFLLKEWEFLEQVIEKGIPCFGFCFGGQLLSMLLGGKVHRNPVMEIGRYEVKLTSAGKNDLIFKGFPNSFPVFQWHEDTFDLPKGAELLVEGEDCRNQAFRYNNIVALQFHLEFFSQVVELYTDIFADDIARLKKTKKQVVEECRISERERKCLCYKLIENFFQLCDSTKVVI